MSDRTLYMTPAELKIHEATLKSAAAGEDPYGDANESVLDAETIAEIAADQKAITTPPPPPETDEAREAAEKDAADKAAAEALAAAQATATPPAPEPPAAPVPPAAPAVAHPPVAADGAPVDLSDLAHLRLTPLPAVDEATYLKTSSELQAKIDAIDAQWEEGTITPEERKVQAGPLRAQVKKLDVDHAALIGEYNATARVNQNQTLAVIDRIKAAGLRDGLDYTNPAKAAQYDAATAAIASDPANAGMSWVQISQRADLAVRTMNGIVAKAPVAAPGPPAAPTPPAATKPPVAPPKREEPPAPPTTLRDLPVAAGAKEHGNTVSARLMSADANQKDAIYKSLSPQQRAALLDE